MKLKIRFLTFILALLCFASAFVACDSESDNDVNQGEEGSDKVEEVHPTIQKNNYNDSCYMHIFEGLQNRYTEESDNDVLTEALYSRQQRLYDYIGVELVGIQTGNLNVYGQAFTNAVKNKDGSVDVLVASAYVGVAEFVGGGYLQTYNDLPHIDLDADYWRMDYMEGLMIDDDIYLGYSDFMIFSTHVISFNKDMMSKYEDALDESLYDSVRNYRWTLDKMISIANLVYTDRTGDGKTEDDTFGITGRQWIPFIGFLHASDIQLVEENEKGQFTVSVYNELNREKTTTLVDKLHELSKSESAWFRFRIEDTVEIPLTSGRTLLNVQASNSLKDNLNYDIEFGVLPFPMFDENQKDVGYRSFNYDGYITFPSYMRNTNMSVETVELLSFFSEPVQIAYYEKLLGKQVADVPDDRDMLELVWDGISSDFGLAYAAIDGTLNKNLYMLPSLTHANTTDQVASYVQSYERTANKAIAKWLAQYRKDHP